jgi:phosphomevalonate kinase
VTVVTASAPGKLILCGEYAVLRDAPAVVMAVDRRATVTITPHEESWHVLSTPGFAHGTWRFEVRAGEGPAWLDGPPQPAMPVVEAVFAGREVGEFPPSRIDIDTRAFTDPESGTKFGLGSSAAATVALVAALAEPGAAVTNIWKRAELAHFEIQGGSGADIAASCFGGLLDYRRYAETVPARLQWPDGLDCRVFFSGVAASTGDAISKSDSTDIPLDRWRELESSAAAAADAWRRGDAGEALDATRQYRDALQRFDEAGIGNIFSAGHDELTRLGDELGIVYKPSGAGGGDCGVALGMDPDRLSEFGEAAQSQGFVPLDVRRDNRGV